MFVVLRWYYDSRDYREPHTPELSGVFGPFSDEDAAEQWIVTAGKWGGWGEYLYKIENLAQP